MARYAADPERRRIAAKRSYPAKREQILEANRRQYAANVQKQRERQRQWRLKNPDKLAAQRARRDALQKGAPGRGITEAQWTEILTVFGHACAYCLARDNPSRSTT